jgi:hypothetical protein
LDATDNRFRDSKFSWIGRLLPLIHKGFLQNSQANDEKNKTSAPVLVVSDLTKKFNIYCDASRQGLGCVLMQEGQVVCYTSRKLRKHE